MFSTALSAEVGYAGVGLPENSPQHVCMCSQHSLHFPTLCLSVLLCAAYHHGKRGDRERGGEWRWKKQPTATNKKDSQAEFKENTSSIAKQIIRLFPFLKRTIKQNPWLWDEGRRLRWIYVSLKVSEMLERTCTRCGWWYRFQIPIFLLIKFIFVWVGGGGGCRRFCLREQHSRGCIASYFHSLPAFQIKDSWTVSVTRKNGWEERKPIVWSSVLTLDMAASNGRAPPVLFLLWLFVFQRVFSEIFNGWNLQPATNKSAMFMY